LKEKRCGGNKGLELTGYNMEIKIQNFSIKKPANVERKTELRRY
jgi:hypothetical protein